MAASDYVLIKPALVGVKSDGKAYLLDDDDGNVIAPSFQFDQAGNVTGLLGEAGRRVGVPVTLFSTAIPVGRAPSGTMGNNGALTVGTSLTKTYSAGIWLYFLANAVYSGSPAGFYWVVMNTDLAGTVYANTYDPTTQAPYIPASPTPITATGPGAYTGVTASVTALRVTVPGGLMGPNGILRLDFSASNNNSANNKGVNIYFAQGAGGGYVTGNVNMTTNVSQRFPGIIVNAGTNNQVATNLSGATTSDIVYRFTANTNQDQFITVNLVGSVASDWAIIQHFFVEVIPS